MEARFKPLKTVYSDDMYRVCEGGYVDGKAHARTLDIVGKTGLYLRHIIREFLRVCHVNGRTNTYIDLKPHSNPSKRYIQIRYIVSFKGVT